VVEHFESYFNELGWHWINDIMMKATMGWRTYVECTNGRLWSV